MDEIVKIGGRFDPEALRILRGIPGLNVQTRTGAARGADAVLRFADGKAPVTVETKTRVNTATAWQLVRRAKAARDASLLVIAHETTAEARAILADHGVALIDGLGNVRIALPGLLFHREGTGRASPARPARLTGRAGLVAQALLLDPERAWKVQDAAKEADVSAGLAHRVLARLVDEGVVTPEGKGKHRVRRVTQPGALLDLWTEETTERPVRTPAHLLARTPKHLVEQVGANLERNEIDHALTGAAAANIVAPFITAVPVAEVWVAAAAAPDDLCKAAGADRVADGHNIVFLQAKNDAPLAFRERVKTLWLANRFRIYADLRRDPRRGREQAANLRREVIGF
jgi:hypothetical protein